MLTRGGESREHQLWNASTGRVYSVTDSALPLSSVGCVFNDANVWANIQTTSSPESVDWRLDDPTKWRPFFGPKVLGLGLGLGCSWPKPYSPSPSAN